MRKLHSFGEPIGQAYPLTHLWRCFLEGAGGRSEARPLICVAAVHGARQSSPGCCLSIAFVSVPLNVVFPCVISMLSWAKSILSLGLRSEEHTAELHSLMSSPFAVLCMKKK